MAAGLPDAQHALCWLTSQGDTTVFNAWCVGSLCLLLSFPLAAEERMYVAVDTVNVRDDPDGLLLSKLHRGAEVSVYDTSGDWSRISEMNASPEWVNSSLLCDVENCWAATARLMDTYTVNDSTRSRGAASPRKPFGTSSGRGSKRPRTYDGGSDCPCSGSRVCVGPRGGRYCITSGGNKRYGL